MARNEANYIAKAEEYAAKAAAATDEVSRKVYKQLEEHWRLLASLPPGPDHNRSAGQHE